MKNKGIIIAIIVVAAIGLIRYVTHPASSDSSAVASVAVRDSLAPANNNQNQNFDPTENSNLAPVFSLPLLGGGSVSLADFRGKQPVVLDFWASWCPNCRRDMPKLSELSKKYKDQVAVIGINLRENQRTVENFVRSHGIAFPIALDSGTVANLYGIQYTNTHFLIDKNGALVKTVLGDISESDIKFLIQQ